MELTLAVNNMTQEMNDDELFWSSTDDEDESSNGMELTLAKDNMTEEMNHDELFWSSTDDEDESSNDMELTLARDNMTQEMNHDELFWSSSDDEDDDMISDMADEPASVDKEEDDCSVDKQEMVKSNHEAVDRDGERNNIIEFVTSDRVRVHRYLDDVVFYEDMNVKEETTQSYEAFIDTDEILNDLMPGSTVPEAPESNIIENSEASEIFYLSHLY